jgi:hypothetical protein
MHCCIHHDSLTNIVGVGAYAEDWESQAEEVGDDKGAEDLHGKETTPKLIQKVSSAWNRVC